MISIKRFASASALVLFFLFFSTQAQTPAVSTVNVTAEEGKVRISAAGDVLDMRVAVSDESGDIVFESGPAAGDKLDWTMKGADGARVPAGAYMMTVTYRTSSGKLRRRVEQVFVTEEVSGSTSAAPEAPTPQAVGSITGQGTTGRLAKFTGTNAVGNSVVTESGGRIGLGTTTPAQSLHALGVSSRLRLHSTGGSSLTATEYVNNVGRVWHAGAGGSSVAGVASKFFIRDNNANQYRLVIDTSGNLGVGTLTPSSKLTVNGGIQIVGAGNGIKFADGSIQTKAIAGTINGTGTANRLAKFTGPNSFGNSSITETSNGFVGIGTAAPQSPLDVRAYGYGLTQTDGGITVGTYVDAEGGWLGTRSNHPLHFFTNNSSPLVTIDTAGNMGVGVSPPSEGRLHVVGGGAQNVIFATSPSGRAVLGISNGNHADAVGIYGANTNSLGYAGYFQGRVTIIGHLNVSSCAGCDPVSDRNLKASISAVNPRHILDRLAAIPIQSWRYKTDPDTVRHIGPMAQDFHAAFGLGRSDKTISSVDAQGVAMASIQALYELLQEKDRQIERQSSQIETLIRKVERQQAQLEQVRRAVKPRRARERAR